MENIVYLSLGSNIEDRLKYLHFGINELQNDPFINVEEVSSIYETKPVGYIEQANFLNLALKLTTSYQPLECLCITQKIEKLAKKNTPFRWGPRTLDLDILLYNQENIKMSNLQIPHPRMMERAFVLIPLMEIAPELIIPNEKEPLQQIISKLEDKDGVVLWKKREIVSNV